MALMKRRMLFEAEGDENEGENNAAGEANASDANNNTADQGNNDKNNNNDQGNDNNDNGDQDNTESNDDEEKDNADDEDYSIDSDMDDDSDDDSSDDSGDDDSSDFDDNDDSSDDSSSEDSEEKQLDRDMFSTLSEDEQKRKIATLKRLYIDLYSKADALIEKFNQVGSLDDEEFGPIVKRILDILYNMKEYVSYYVLNIFDKSSYIENDITFNRYLAVLDGVKLCVEELDKQREDEKDKK